jgi:hypothetical protein
VGNSIFSSVIKTKGMSKKKIKGPAKKAKSAAPKAKSAVGKKTKAKATKSKAVVKSNKKVAAKKVVAKKTAKRPAVKVKAKDTPVKAKASRPAPVVKAKAKSSKKTKRVAKPVVQQVLSHGIDQHFIPVHDKNAPITSPDPHKAENQFHHNEEVALHQENQKVKANMATRMGRKQIFRTPRRG